MSWFLYYAKVVLLLTCMNASFGKSSHFFVSAPQTGQYSVSPPFAPTRVRAHCEQRMWKHGVITGSSGQSQHIGHGSEILLILWLKSSRIFSSIVLTIWTCFFVALPRMKYGSSVYCRSAAAFQNCAMLSHAIIHVYSLRVEGAGFNKPYLLSLVGSLTCPIAKDDNRLVVTLEACGACSHICNPVTHSILLQHLF